jgi:hypothetical protein
MRSPLIRQGVMVKKIAFTMGNAGGEHIREFCNEELKTGLSC